MKNHVIVSVLATSVLGACVADQPIDEHASAITSAEAIAEIGPLVSQVIAPVAGPQQLSDAGDGSAAQSALTTAVIDPSCVTSRLSGLSITLTYAGCINGRGETVDGDLSLALELVPLRVSMTLDQFAVGPSGFDGTIGLTFPAGGGAVVDADIGLVLENDVELGLAGASIAASAGQVVVDGAATLTSPEAGIALDADALTWTGDCLPSGGSVDYDDGAFNGTLIFSPDTPATGIVTAVVGPIRFEIALPPCA